MRTVNVKKELIIPADMRILETEGEVRVSLYPFTMDATPVIKSTAITHADPVLSENSLLQAMMFLLS